MEKQVVLFDSLYAGKTKNGDDFYSVKFFQIVTGRWGTRRVDVPFYVSKEQYDEAAAFAEKNKCVIGDVLEIGVKISKNLTRAPAFVKILSVVESSPLIKYAVSEADDDLDEDDEPIDGFVPVKTM